MAFTSFNNDWALPDFLDSSNATTKNGTALSQDFGGVDYAKLAQYLEQHPAGTYGSLPPDAFSLVDSHTILLPPPQPLNADDTVSSPESSSAASSSNNERQDSAPLEAALLAANNAAAAPAAATNKRKTAGDAAVPAAALKDSRRGSARTKETVLHTHDEQEGPTATAAAKGGSKKNGTSEKRKEQNRNAQRAFRERRERHAKELEDKVAELQAEAAERDAENQNLKDMVTRLRSENEKLSSAAFTFAVPSSLNASTASSALAASSGSTPAFNSGVPSLFGGLAPTFGSSFAAATSKPADPNPFSFSAASSSSPPSFPDSPNELFAPPAATAGDASAAFADFGQGLFTPSGEHLNPLASFEELLGPASTAAPPALPDSALSPGSAEALFSAYRDPSAPAQQASAAGFSFGGFEPLAASSSASPSTPSLVESRSTPPIPEGADRPTAECHVFRQSLGSLRGAEDFDLDSLCKDMMQKATCKQAAAVALEQAVSDDIDIHSFFSTILADSTVKATYKK